MTSFCSTVMGYITSRGAPDARRDMSALEPGVRDMGENCHKKETS